MKPANRWPTRPYRLDGWDRDTRRWVRDTYRQMRSVPLTPYETRIIIGRRLSTMEQIAVDFLAALLKPKRRTR